MVQFIAETQLAVYRAVVENWKIIQEISPLEQRSNCLFRGSILDFNVKIIEAGLTFMMVSRTLKVLNGLG